VKHFSGKAAADLDITEAAYIAAIPQAPTYFSPYGNNKDKLDARKKSCAAKMLGNKKISQEEYDAAKREQVVFLPQGNTGIKAPQLRFLRPPRTLKINYGAQAIENDGPEGNYYT